MRKALLVSLTILLATAFIFGSCSAPTTTPPKAPTAPATPPKAESLKDFYENGTITLVVTSFGGGSNTDTVGRLLAPSMTEVLGSKVVVKNMGEGGTEGTNWLYTKAKPDGLNLAQTSYTRDVLNQVSGTPGVLYDFFKFRVIADTYTEACGIGVSNKYKTLQDLVNAKDVKAGSSATSGQSVANLVSLLETTGVDAKIISGFQGSAGQSLAMGKGEIDLMAFPMSTIQRLVVDTGYGKALCVMSEKRSKAFPDVPTIYELGKVSPQVASILGCSGEEANLVIAPPGTPQDKIDFLRKAYETILADKAVVTNLVKANSLPHAWVKGADIEARLAKVAADKALATNMTTLAKKYLAAK